MTTSVERTARLHLGRALGANPGGIELGVMALLPLFVLPALWIFELPAFPSSSERSFMSEFPAPPALPQTGFGQSASGPSGPRAGFWPRLAAAVIDVVLVGIVGLVLQVGLGRAGWILSVAIGIAYFGYLEGSRSGQTLGKRTFGIRVIDLHTGGPIGFGRAVIRCYGRVVSALPCFLGYFWMLRDRERQTWHDKFATDVVVPVSVYPVSSWPN